MVFMINLLGLLVGLVGVGLVVVAVDLLVEALGIKRAGGTGDAGDHRKRNQRRQDGLHDQSPWIVGGIGWGWVSCGCGRSARRSSWHQTRWRYRRRRRSPKA